MGLAFATWRCPDKMRLTNPPPQSGRGQTPRTATLGKVLEMQYHPPLGWLRQQSSETQLDTLEEVRLNMKKSFFLYPTIDGDIVLSGYPSWVYHSDVYPFRIYTFLLDEDSSKRIGEKSVNINTVTLLSDENECGTPASVLSTDTQSEQLTINFTPWRRNHQ